MPAPKTVRLSKSRIMTGLQCPKALYLKIHSPELAAEVSKGQQFIFDQGHAVGMEAHKMFPQGILIEDPHLDAQRALRQTQEAIESGALAIFEATLQVDGVLVQIDILKRDSLKHAWEILEVKSSTQVKEIYIMDAAIQLWVARQVLPKVKSASVVIINTECAFPHLEDLLEPNDITKEAEAFLETFPQILKELKTMAAKPKPPKKEIGPHCDSPYECAFKAQCWEEVPSPSIFDIPRLQETKKWELYSKGKVSLASLDPEDFTDTQAKMIRASVKNVRTVDKKAVKKEIAQWKFPLSFLDFETIGMAIPRYKGVRAFQALPFQFSCHTKKNAKAKPEHFEYLHTEDSDPRKAMAEALVKFIPSEGSIVAFNKGTEGGILKKLAEEFPKHKKALLSMAERLVDPLPIFRAHIYDPGFGGGFSIKDIAPALLGESASYEGMEVAGGQEAQAAYLKLIAAETSAKEKELLRQGLIDYCTKDTFGMVQLVDWLFGQVD